MTIYTTVIGTAIAFLAGTAAHEFTHAGVATALGARIQELHPLPPAPRVVYDAPSQSVDALVRVAPIAAAIPLLVIVMLAMLGRPLREQVVLVAFAAAYVPRSGADWAPVAGLF